LPYVPTDLPGYKLRRAAHMRIGDLAQLAALGLRLSEATVLLLVGNRTDMTASEIGRLLDIQRANMVPLLKTLESAGLTERRPLDRKSFAVVLTPLGETRREQVQAITDRFEADLVARIPAAHRAHLLPILDALLG
jgi:DNA-binding MarR family transcriptional regulator